MWRPHSTSSVPLERLALIETTRNNQSIVREPNVITKPRANTCITGRIIDLSAATTERQIFATNRYLGIRTFFFLINSTASQFIAGARVFVSGWTKNPIFQLFCKSPQYALNRKISRPPNSSQLFFFIPISSANNEREIFKVHWLKNSVETLVVTIHNHVMDFLRCQRARLIV